MKKLSLTIAFLMACILLNAQFVCHEPDDIIQRSTDPCERAIPDDWIDSGLLAKNFIPNNSTPIIIIPVNINVWREDDGTGNCWLDTPEWRDSLQKAFFWLNYIYSHNEPYTLNIPDAQFVEDTRVRFVIDTIFYYNNSLMAHKSSTFDFTNYLIANHPERLNRFNYHLSLNTTVYYSGCSSGYNVQYPAIVSVKQVTNQSPELYAFGMHMAHEFGHNFGLGHTYNSEDTVIAHPEFLWDVFGTATQSWCNEPPIHVCYHDWGWSCNPEDTTNTCTNNIMGGTYMSNHFSALQCGRLHRALQVSTLRNYAYSENPSAVMHVEKNQKIDYQKKFFQSIAIDSGVTLTVSCRLEMAPSTRIIVQPGGKLIIDGGTITSAGAGEMWQGIEVVGDRTKHQEPQYQGVVELKNGAVIENAVNAIRTGIEDDNWYTTGGIIMAEDAIFRNNQRAIEFLSYHDNISNSTILDNCSYFTRCTFILDTNNVLTQNNHQFYNHVTMWDVKNVKFKGCSFENRTSEWMNEGKGIFEIDAGFSLTTYPYPYALYENGGGIFLPDTFLFNTFSGFNTAIEVETSGNQYGVKIDEAKFTNNQLAIAIDGNNYVEIIRCDIDLTQNTSPSLPKIQGVSLNHCTGYHVEANNFHSSTNPSLSNGTINKFGIKILGSGTAFNKIYKNDFLRMVNGILVSGTNGNMYGGLQFCCNSFNSGSYDIRLLSRTVVSPQQGQLSKGADNIFNRTNEYNFYNGGNSSINYLYNSSNTFHIPSLYYQIVPSSQNVISNPCNSTILDLNPYRFDDDIDALANMASTYQDMEEELASQMVISDGNNELSQSIPSEKMTLRQEASELYYQTARRIMFDSLMDLSVLETLHQTASVFSDPYSLSETRYQMDETSDNAYTGIEDENERNNYAAFRALKAECAAQTTEKGVNWYSLSNRQIEELIRIAERNSGRSSVMAKGILCFFYGICYEEEEEIAEIRSAVCQNEGNPSSSETKSDANTKEKSIQNGQIDTSMSLFPNPAKQTVTIQFFGNHDNVKKYTFVNMQGTVVLSEEKPNSNTIDISKLPASMYIVHVFGQSGKVYSAKLVKE
jgi:hypothetical protein